MFISYKESKVDCNMNISPQFRTPTKLDTKKEKPKIQPVVVIIIAGGCCCKKNELYSVICNKFCLRFLLSNIHMYMSITHT